MAEDPRRILGLNDTDLQEWALSGEAGSYVHELGQTAMNMRSSLRMAAASEHMASTNRELVCSTQSLVRQTRSLVRATWGLVVITILAQIALLVISVLKKAL